MNAAYRRSLADDHDHGDWLHELARDRALDAADAEEAARESDPELWEHKR